jgi:hypothetical protein
MNSGTEEAYGSTVHLKFVGTNFLDESTRKVDNLELFFGYL